MLYYTKASTNDQDKVWYKVSLKYETDEEWAEKLKQKWWSDS